MSENSRLYFLLRKLIKAVENLSPTAKLKIGMHVVSADTEKFVPTNKIWDILSGTIYHKSLAGTATYVLFANAEGYPFFSTCPKIADATATDFYPIDFKGCKILLTEWDQILAGLDAGEYLEFRYIERSY